MFRTNYEHANAAIQPGKNLISNTKEAMAIKSLDLEFLTDTAAPDRIADCQPSPCFHSNREQLLHDAIFLILLAACAAIILFGVSNVLSVKTSSPRYGATFTASPAAKIHYNSTSQTTKNTISLSKDSSSIGTAME